MPGTTRKLQKKFPNLRFVFNPEFLTERTSKLDMITQSRIIFGGSRSLTNKVEELFSIRFKSRHYIHTDTNTAEYIKYMNNTFFATKVSVMNEFYRLSKKLDIDWKWVKGHSGHKYNEIVDDLARDAASGNNLLDDEGYQP